MAAADIQHLCDQKINPLESQKSFQNVARWSAEVAATVMVVTPDGGTAGAPAGGWTGNQRTVGVSASAAPAAALLFGGGLRLRGLRGLQASHLEVGDQLGGNLRQHRLGQRRLGSLKEEKAPNEVSWM